MKFTVIVLFLVALLVGCQQERGAQPQQQPMAQAKSEWKQGDVVELTGMVRPARTESKYFIETNEGRGASIRSEAIDKLPVGATVWIKGKIEYVHYSTPKDYQNDIGGVNYGVGFPQTICYIKVSEHKILDPQQPISSD